MKSTSKKQAYLIKSTFLFFILLSQSVSADYYRFWRGYMKPGISSESFSDLLNTKLIPETIKLSETAAKLKGYAPVYVPEDISRQYGLPNEFAILSYEDETSYRAYRETQVGKDYGNLHWELFDKSTSKSLVPVKLSDSGIELNAPEHAYFATGKTPGSDFWSSYHHVSVVHLTDERQSATFDADLVDHVKRVQAIGPTLYIVLREAKNVFEYVSFANASGLTEYLTTTRTRVDPDMGVVDEITDAFIEVSGKVVFSAELNPTSKIQPGQGLLYTAAP